MRSVARFSWLLACLMAALAGLQAQSSREIRQAASLVQRGDRFFKSGNAEKATESFRKALTLIPGYPEAHFGLGHIAMTEERFEDALAEYRSAEEGYSGVSDLMARLQQERYADAQREIRELEDQIRVINDASVKVSESTRTQKTLQLEEKIRVLRAMEYPTTAEAHQPPAQLYFHKGNALFRLQRSEEALADWETCVAQAPEFPLVYNNLAIIYMQQQRFDEAWNSVGKAEELGVTVNPNLKADLLARAAAAGIDLQGR